MFAAKTTILLALLAVSSKLVAAGPPACLLAAIKYDLCLALKWEEANGCGSTESNPEDLQTICGDDASKVMNQIASLCGSNKDTAMQAFVDTCSAAGKTVREYSSAPQRDFRRS